jgi:hypothetical protein
MQAKSYVIEISHLEDGRMKLADIKTKVTITNSPNTLNTYGIFATIIILETLRNEFSNIVIDFQINVQNNLAAIVSAIKLGHKNIIFDEDYLSSNQIDLTKYLS